MIFANAGGVIGMALAVAAGWGFQLWIGPALFGEYEDMPLYSIQFAALTGSIFALAYDRYSGTALLRGYREALATFFGSIEPGYAARTGIRVHPGSRIAAFGIPLAFGPFFLLGVALVIFAVDYGTSMHSFSLEGYGRFMGASLLSILIWLVFARVFRDRRDVSARGGGQ